MNELHDKTRSFSPASLIPEQNRHSLIAVVQYLPGEEPTDYDITLAEGDGYQTRFWRCQYCGQERNRRSEFREPCAVEEPSTPLSDGGYSVDDSRTRRALTEQMVIRFLERGGRYEVHSESGSTYEVDVREQTCTCLDFQNREPDGGCKHLRRVDLEVRAGNVPGADGTFQR